jgi:hypothetical protein
MSVQQRDQRPLILYMDNTDQSAAIRESLERAGVVFCPVYAAGRMNPLPAIETPSGIVWGYRNIRRYVIPETVTEPVG